MTWVTTQIDSHNTSLIGVGAPTLPCSSSINNGYFYTSSALELYQCSLANGYYQWNLVGGAGLGEGTTGTITGTVLTSTCDSGTASVPGAVVGNPVAVSSTTGADVGGAFNLRASVLATGVVTVYVCGTGTPVSLAYNVTVF
jgi:hypothetical protein